MNVDDAAYHVVHDYPGGQAALGLRAGINAALLGNKVRASCSTNVLSLAEAVKITGVTGDHRILAAWAAQENFRLVPVDVADAGSIVSTLLEQNVREGAFARVMGDALADGVITPNEMKSIEKAAGDVQGVMLNLLRQLSAKQAVSP
jgi:uncharacterized membrane protein YebE (DUF533 family)